MDPQLDPTLLLALGVGSPARGNSGSLFVERQRAKGSV
jgi:hypothetical protein